MTSFRKRLYDIANPAGLGTVFCQGNGSSYGWQPRVSPEDPEVVDFHGVIGFSAQLFSPGGTAIPGLPLGVTLPCFSVPAAHD